jgi:hypothetical protein
LAVSEDVQNCADEEEFKSLVEWDSQETLQWKVLGEILVSLVSMKELTKINRMLSVGMLIKKSDERSC